VRRVTRHCITNSMPTVRSCTVAGEHRAHCDGHARAVDAETGRTTILTKACTGCLPRPAHRGYLCYDHITKLDYALDDVVELVAFMRLEQSNGIRDTNDGGGGSAGPSWVLPESRIMTQWVNASMANAMAVLRGSTEVDFTYLDGQGHLYGDVNERRNALQVGLDDLIGTPLGAEAAVHMTRSIQRAYSKFPLVETEHNIVGIRCPNCSQARLKWIPPLMHKGDVVIRCAGCQHIERQQWLEQYASVMQLRPARRGA
jgi:hypothetical protein